MINSSTACLIIYIVSLFGSEYGIYLFDKKAYKENRELIDIMKFLPVINTIVLFQVIGASIAFLYAKIETELFICKMKIIIRQMKRRDEHVRRKIKKIINHERQKN